MSGARILLSRRKFATTLLAGGFAAVSPTRVCFSSQALTPASGSDAGWFDRPMRWAQLTLVENDPGSYDPEFWLNYFKRTHSDAACLSAGGVVAYYPTKVPFHHRSGWMGSTDPFGELFNACRKMGMNVIARTDPHATHQKTYDAHPDWIAVDSEGKHRRHWASPELWVTCALGPYNFEFMTAVHREILSSYRVDGIFSNRWTGSGMCYCQHCRKNFAQATGMELPRTSDPKDPARRQYILWRQQRLFQVWDLWDAEIRKLNPDARFIANSGGGALSDLDMKEIGRRASILFADRQARRGLSAPWDNGKNAKEYRSTLGRKPVGGIFSVGVEEPYRWKDSVQSEAEIRIWVADGVAHGIRPWFTKFSGTLYDKRWLGTVERVYERLYRAERYLRNEKSLARVGLVFSQQTAWFYGGPRAQQKVEDHILGMYHALIEARVPFDMVHDRMLEPEQITGFKLLILPNIAALSEGQCEQLRTFARSGGSLLATYETSLYDEWGVQRSDFGLSELFGARFKGRPEGPMQNSYLGLQKDPATGKFHPVLKDLENTPRIINGVWRLDVEAREKFLNPPLTLIPSYPDLPMEMVYPRVKGTDKPELYLRENGQSRIAYFPWDIDRTFWEVLAVDHGRLLRNVIDWTANEERPVTVTGPGILDISVWRQKNSTTVHLVNLTNPMMMKGPFRELIPIGQQQVRLKLPPGSKVRKVQLLTAASTPQATERNGYLNVIVPTVLDHEIVAVDL